MPLIIQSLRLGTLVGRIFSDSFPIQYIFFVEMNFVRLVSRCSYKLIDPIGSELLRCPSSSEQILGFATGTFKSSILSLFANPSGATTFVDVGANTGQTMLDVFSVIKHLDYHGFEPNPLAFVHLEKLANANNLSVSLYPFACTNFAKPIKLFASSELDSSATIHSEIRPDTYQGQLGRWIAGYPLDLLMLESIEHGFILKIDVEGSENEVLEGAGALIEKKRPIIICEVLHAHRLSEVQLNNNRKGWLDRFLQRMDYDLYQCVLSPGNREQLVGLNKISQLPKDVLWKDSPHTCDYLFIPREMELPGALSQYN